MRLTSNMYAELELLVLLSLPPKHRLEAHATMPVYMVQTLYGLSCVPTHRKNLTKLCLQLIHAVLLHH